MRLSSSYLFFLWLVLIAACSAPDTPETPKPTTQPTNELMWVPFTRVAIPASFEMEFKPGSATVSKGDQWHLDFAEYNGVKYDEVAANFDRDMLESVGITVHELTKTEVSGYPATFMIAEFTQGLPICSLMFGNDNFCLTAMGGYPIEYGDKSDEIKSVFHQLHYDPDHVFDLFEGESYRMDAESAGLSFITKVGGAIGLSPKDDTTQSPSAIRLIGYPEEREGDLDATLKTLFQQYEVLSEDQIREEKRNTESVNGLPAIRVEREIFMGTKWWTQFIQVIDIGEEHLVLDGLAKIDQPEHLESYHTLVASIELNSVSEEPKPAE